VLATAAELLIVFQADTPGKWSKSVYQLADNGIALPEGDLEIPSGEDDKPEGV
jgi:hypothetical protein